MKPLFKLFLLTLLLSPLRAHADDSHDQSKVLRAGKLPKSSVVPKQIVDEIAKMMKSETSFLNLKVSLFDHHGLLNPPIKILTSRGGGVIDLEPLLPEGKAQFSLRIRLFDGGSQPVTPDKVFFVPQLSNLKDKKEQNCGKYFDVTSYFNKKLMSDEGVETYLTQGIYASNFVGSFIFVKKGEKDMGLALLRFEDGRFSRWACSPQAAPAK